MARQIVLPFPERIQAQPQTPQKAIEPARKAA
jgi:hypothetical protein